MPPQNVPFLIHLVLETAAAASFIFRPEKQLPNCSAAAKLILRQYGGLLLSTNLVFHLPSSGSATRLPAVALGTYHAWPVHRTISRLRNEVQGDAAAAALGGPLLHLVLHLECLAAFLVVALVNDGGLEG